MLEPGTYPIMVAQTRVGPNAGVVTVAEGQVSLIAYQTSIYRVSSGKFLKGGLFTSMSDLRRDCP